jgi:hypothetical protein
VAIDLPGPVVDLMQFFGINWPTIDQDSVRVLAAHVRTFAQNVEGWALQEISSAVGGGSVGASFMVHPDEFVAHSAVIRGHAETAAGHAQAFRAAVAGVSFA